MSDIDVAIDRLEDLKEDESVPTNIREVIDQSIEVLQDDEEDLSVRINAATSLLDQISNDPNIQQYTRTEVWNIASMLESAGNNA